ncbi:SDR family oxidoreductase [Labrys okinawensis]|uniref:SDR family oxidoreductase n=1 Tax=Labrys okinawensis TaxID=346911 RepID=UPI0039BD3C36
MKTILITGCSSGFGLETAKYFLDRNWKVVATMRTPREDALPRSEHLRVLALDVTDLESIHQAVEAAGPLDALVNNAGFGAASPLETTPMAMVRQLFETNTFGAMAVTQAVLPQFRQRKAGVVVNVTSSVTLKSIPLVASYTASKAAVNAFTEVLALEVEQFNVRVRLVLPGRSPETRFADNARSRMPGLDHEAYADLVKSVFARFGEPGPITHAQDVAEAVWRAVNDPSSPMRIPAGADAVSWAESS